MALAKDYSGKNMFPWIHVEKIMTTKNERMAKKQTDMCDKKFK